MFDCSNNPCADKIWIALRSSLDEFKLLDPDKPQDVPEDLKTPPEKVELINLFIRLFLKLVNVNFIYSSN